MVFLVEIAILIFKFTALQNYFIMPKIGILLTLIIYVFMGICLLLMP